MREAWDVIGAGVIITGVIMGEYMARVSPGFGNTSIGFGNNSGREIIAAWTSLDQSED